VHGAEDAGEQLEPVGHAEQHALLRPHPESTEPSGNPLGLVGKLLVGMCSATGDDRGGGACAVPQMSVE
jgi:hypothetical protein